ncbi:MAG: hypothetical protein FWE23_09500 [Chitinivibrionia bacterium]|nr:hypothetical protein [Chitinivibrionia bacterium]
MEKWQEEMAAIRAAMAENMKGFAELRELQKKSSEEADKRLEKLDKLVGGISKNNGLYAEQFFKEALEETKTFAGVKFEKFMPNLKYEKKETCEFDIVMVNGNSVAIIEVKSRIHPSLVEELATTKLTKFRKYFTEYAKYKVYLGVAGFSFDDTVIEKAKEFGVGVIRQHGKTIEMNADALKSY